MLDQKAELLALCDSYNALAAELGITPTGRAGRTDGAPERLPGALGAKRDELFQRVEELAAQTPTEAPASGMRLGSASPLDGRWRLRFTTAADAKPPGVGETFQEVREGVIVNVLEFPAPSPLERIEVCLEGCEQQPARVGLVFDRVRTRWREPQWFAFWKRETELVFPRPGSFIAEVLARLTNADRESGAYFDVLFLDDELRIHRTKEGNVFIQTRLPPLESSAATPPSRLDELPASSRGGAGPPVAPCVALPAFPARWWLAASQLAGAVWPCAAAAADGAEDKQAQIGTFFAIQAATLAAVWFANRQKSGK